MELRPWGPAVSDVSAILKALPNNRAAAERLAPLVLGELRRIAAGRLRGERPTATLEPTAMADEVFMRLAGQSRVSWQGRSHFFAIAAQEVQRLLLDHVKAKRRVKRGGRGGRKRVTLSRAGDLGLVDGAIDAVEIAELIQRLEAIEEREARVVQMRIYMEMTEKQIAAVLGCSVRTVQDDRRHAKAWLKRELAGGSKA